MNNRDEELLNGIIDVPSQNNNQNNLEYNFNFETQVNQTPIVNNNSSYTNSQPVQAQPTSTQPSSIVQQPAGSEAYVTSTPSQMQISNSNIDQPVLQPVQEKQMNQELLNNLNNDTNNFVNPDLIVNPSVKQLEEKPEVLNVEEPKVNYKEITEKKNYMFMFIIFAIVILFIIFLPKIAALIGI